MKLPSEILIDLEIPIIIRDSYNNSLRLFNLRYYCSVLLIPSHTLKLWAIVLGTLWRERLSNSENVLLLSMVQFFVTLGSSLDAFEKDSVLKVLEICDILLCPMAMS